MIKILVTLLMISGCCGFTYCQTVPRFNLTMDGVKPVIVTLDASYTASRIYNKAKSWNASIIQYPQSAIRVDKQDVQLKFAGYIEEGWKIRDNNFDHWYPLQYTMNVEIKDGRCRVTIEIPEVNYKIWYNPDGTTIKKFIESENSFETSINKLLTSLYNYIKGSPKKIEDNW